MLKSDNNTIGNEENEVDINSVNASEMQKKLIQAIRNSRYSSNSDDLIGYHDYCKEQRQVELTKPLWTQYYEDIGYQIWDDNDFDFFIFYGDDAENPDWFMKRITINDKQIPQIISLIRK